MRSVIITVNNGSRCRIMVGVVIRTDINNTYQINTRRFFNRRPTFCFRSRTDTKYSTLIFPHNIDLRICRVKYQIACSSIVIVTGYSDFRRYTAKRCRHLCRFGRGLLPTSVTKVNSITPSVIFIIGRYSKCTIIVGSEKLDILQRCRGIDMYGIPAVRISRSLCISHK